MRVLDVRLLVVIIAFVIVGCTATLRTQLDKMSIVRLSPRVFEDIREEVWKQFKCPRGSKFVYFLGEGSLVDNTNRIGVRCE